MGIIQAQNVGIGTATPHPKAVLHLEDSTRCLLVPRMTTAQRDTLTNLTEGLVIYNVTTHCLEFWNGSQWISTCASTLPCSPPPTPVPIEDTVKACLAQDVQLCVNDLGLTYVWTGPNGFYQVGACVTVSNVTTAALGVYTVYAYNATTNCRSKDTQVVLIQNTTPYFTCNGQPSDSWYALPAPPATIATRGDYVISQANGRIFFGIGENGSCLNDWWEWDTCSATWTQRSNLPKALGGASFIFSLNNSIYVGGGGWGCSTHYADVYKYDINTDTWSAVASLPMARLGAVGTSDGNYGYIFGGELSNGTTSDTIWRYDPITNSWTYLTTYPGGGRKWAFIVYHNNKLYVGTGQNNSNTCLNDFYSFDLSTNTWTTLANFPQNIYDSWAALDPVNERIYVTGYWLNCAGTPTAQWYYYDIASNTWNPMATFPPGARNNVNLVYVNGVFYGGFGEGPYVRDWWAYCP